MARFHLNTHEIFFHVSLQFSDSLCPSMFSPWIKPGQTLTNQLEKNESSIGNARLVLIPSLYHSYVPWFMIEFGSEVYGLTQPMQ